MATGGLGIARADVTIAAGVVPAGTVAAQRTRIAGMRDMVATLHDLADGCAGNDRPDCPIIEGWAGRVGTRVRLKGGPSRSAGAA